MSNAYQSGDPSPNNPSFLNVLTDVFAAPSKAFASLREYAFTWQVLVLSLVVILGMLGIFYATVDFEWMFNAQLDASPTPMSPAEREAAESFMTLGVTATIGIIAFAVAILIAYLLQALYFMVSANMGGSKIPFGKWFAFSIWVYVPTLITSIIAIVTMLVSDNNQYMLETINPISLNALVTQYEIGDPLLSLATRIDPFYIWSVIVSIIGFKVWTKCSMAKSVIVNLILVGLSFGLGYLFAVMVA